MKSRRPVNSSVGLLANSMRSILLILFFFGFAWGIVLNSGSSARTHGLADATGLDQKDMDLEVRLVADKRTYTPRDRIKLEVKLVNNHAVKDIFVYGTLQFGLRASFTLYRRDQKGKEVPTRFIDTGSELPPKSNDTEAFVKLLPFHFLGKPYRSTIYMLHMERPGRYTMWVEYHCPLSSAEVEVKPFWGRENGVIKSNVVSIEVVR
jgi:hypothetical protein